MSCLSQNSTILTVGLESMRENLDRSLAYIMQRVGMNVPGLG